MYLNGLSGYCSNTSQVDQVRALNQRLKGKVYRWGANAIGTSGSRPLNWDNIDYFLQHKAQDEILICDFSHYYETVPDYDNYMARVREIYQRYGNREDLWIEGPNEPPWSVDIFSFMQRAINEIRAMGCTNWICFHKYDPGALWRVLSDPLKKLFYGFHVYTNQYPSRPNTGSGGKSYQDLFEEAIVLGIKRFVNTETGAHFSESGSFTPQNVAVYSAFLQWCENIRLNGITINGIHYTDIEIYNNIWELTGVSNQGAYDRNNLQTGWTGEPTPQPEPEPEPEPTPETAYLTIRCYDDRYTTSNQPAIQGQIIVDGDAIDAGRTIKVEIGDHTVEFKGADLSLLNWEGGVGLNGAPPYIHNTEVNPTIITINPPDTANNKTANAVIRAWYHVATPEPPPPVYSLTVKVRDENAPIAMANVTVNELTYSTDIDGNVVYTLLETGEYQVVVSKEGYENNISTVNLASDTVHTVQLEKLPSDCQEYIDEVARLTVVNNSLTTENLGLTAQISTLEADNTRLMAGIRESVDKLNALVT